MDFFRVCIKEDEKKGKFEIFPDFVVGRSKDIMIRGGSFYAIWDEAAGLWSTDEYDVQRLVDEEINKFVEKNKAALGSDYSVKYLRNNGSGAWAQFKRYISNLSDSYHVLDQTLTFSNTEVKKEDYVSKRLPYRLEAGDISAWDELVGTLYSVPEREKIEWIIGAIVSGDSKVIQKFGVLYGAPASGKGTILEIIERLFAGYTTAFDAKALGSANKDFATEPFKTNPLVAIQQDGDLSRIEDNTRLNSIVSHERMSMNEKYKSAYTDKVCAFCLMGTNTPVKISDAKSGIIRRLIDIHPTGVRISENHYYTLMARIDFELGAIAQHCLDLYRKLGKNHYTGYRPVEMMFQTDVFYNFIEYNFDIFEQQDSTTLKQAYILYKEFCHETGVERNLMPMYKVREELRNYFDEFKDRHTIDGVLHRSWYGGFNANKFKYAKKEPNVYSLVMDETESLLDVDLALMPAQYEVWDEDMEIFRPQYKWKNVKTKLLDVNTKEIHYVRVPEHHIVIDFDLKDEDGNKSLERNLEAASVWPATYAELSKSGNGVHLHYTYAGDVRELAAKHSEGIEIKTLLGDAALRRRLSKCNNIPVAEYPNELPKKEKPVLDLKTVQNEKHLRVMIAKNLRKEFAPGTKSSVDFIKKLLDEMYETGQSYDVSDLKPRILSFALGSSHQAITAVKTVKEMKFTSDDLAEPQPEAQPADPKEDVALAFFDLEVYPNLFAIGWSFDGSDTVQKLVNPTPGEVEQLIKTQKLVGYNCRRYDNHILYAALQGYDNEALFRLSQKIIVERSRDAFFGAAYDLSYADMYEILSEKMSLKAWEIKLGIKHMEMDIPWDKPVTKEQIERILKYMENDIHALKAVFHARQGDWKAQQILASLSGLKMNDTTSRHTAQIVFKGDRNPQVRFNNPDLSKEFPGYEFHMGKSTYRGKNPSEGGYVSALPGMYEDVGVLDIASMHPTTIRVLDLFGPYTKNYNELVDARLAIKDGRLADAAEMMGGRLEPYLNSGDLKALSDALKIVINTVYGLTAASFDNPFRDRRNKDNKVAKRGALFMVELESAAEEKGMEIVHIKTDSVKIPNMTHEDALEVMLFGEKYGYTFVHETTYTKFCLVDDAQYIAKEGDVWHAKGAKFAHPYVFKTLFTGEPLTFYDLCETKQVTKGSMYLDYDHERPEPHIDRMVFMGRTNRFIPVLEGGGVLYRTTDRDEKLFSVTGTKGHLWMPVEIAEQRKDEIRVDMSYFEKLAESAKKKINSFGDFDWFVS